MFDDVASTIHQSRAQIASNDVASTINQSLLRPRRPRRLFLPVRPQFLRLPRPATPAAVLPLAPAPILVSGSRTTTRAPFSAQPRDRRVLKSGMRDVSQLQWQQFRGVHV